MKSNRTSLFRRRRITALGINTDHGKRPPNKTGKK